MNSDILIKINSFIKKRLIELLGIILVLASIFLLASMISYSPSDPNFIYTPETTEIKNIGGFYGSVLSDFLLQALGLVSFFLAINFFYWGVKLTKQKIINNFINKIFYIFIYSIFGTTALNVLYSDSYWLIDNGRGGFVGQSIKENIYHFTPLIENQYLILSFILLSVVFFIMSLGIRKDEILSILYFPIFLIKKNFKFISEERKRYSKRLKYQ